MCGKRYSRQMLFAPIGEAGQSKLADFTILVVGVGALGTVISNHLVRSGVGTLRIVDRDYVELSNLQRQMLFDENDVEEALPKVIAAKKKLEKINNEVTIEAIIDNVSNENIDLLTKDVDLVLDGTDNLATRFLLNDICFKKGIPFSYGGVVASRGMTAFFNPGETPCLRCVMSDSASSGQTCDTAGVISPAVDLVSSIQATSALKYLTGNKQYINQAMDVFDVWYNNHYQIRFKEPESNCPTCQQQIFPSLNKKAVDDEVVLCGRNTVQINYKQEMNLTTWKNHLERVAHVKRTPFLLKVEFDKEIQFVIFPNGRVLIQGTEDPVIARTWYDKYIGS